MNTPRLQKNKKTNVVVWMHGVQVSHMYTMRMVLQFQKESGTNGKRNCCSPRDDASSW